VFASLPDVTEEQKMTLFPTPSFLVSGNPCAKKKKARGKTKKGRKTKKKK
jgi:hypothetical protein